MRVVIAMMKHETNTFSPVPTPLSRFDNGGPEWNGQALAAYSGTATPMGAFIDLAKAEGAEIVTPVAAEAWPSGPVQDSAYARLCDAIAEEVDKGCDLVLLDLHGAMVTESLEDGEGELVARLRALAPETPIAVALDLHANLSDKIVDNADVVTGFKTYPHTDMYETGALAGEIAFRALKGGCRPTMAWGNRPMLPHIMRQGSADSPMRELIAAARQAEADGALAVSVFGGFPHADIRDAGIGVVAVTDGDPDGARAICDAILDRAWEHRHGFVYRSEPAEDAVARAAKLADGPVLLLDHCDNCGSGGTQDVMAVLGEILRQGLEDVAAFAIHDPQAVDAMMEAGIGAEVTLDLGRQAGHAGDRQGRRTAQRHRPGQAAVIRRVYDPRPHVHRRHRGDGPNRRPGHRQGRDRGDRAPPRALGCRLPAEPWHRARGQALHHAEIAGALAGRILAGGAPCGRMRRRRRDDFGLRSARFPPGAAPDIPARSRRRVDLKLPGDRGHFARGDTCVRRLS